MAVVLQMNERESEYVPVFDAIIMQGRYLVVAEGAKTFAGPYTSLSVYLGSCLLHGNTITNVFTAITVHFHT